MQLHEVFFNSTGRLRSGWRVSIFTLFFIVLSFFSTAFLELANFLLKPLSLRHPWIVGLFEGLFRVALLLVAVLAGWGCGRLLESLPWRAFGWSLHKGAMRDLLVGSIVGCVSLMFAAGIATAFGSLRFSFSGVGAIFVVGKTLLFSGFLFLIAAAAEEALFRGYPLQTLTRAGLWWVGVLLTSVPFAVLHLENPNIVPGFTFVNTALAGIWLAAAYLRTRSLWFPLGVHWAWNWTMAAVFGIPVSGITKLTPNPMFRSSDLGPAWLSGGSYGIEGGVACTVAIVLSTLFIWRTKLISATDEMIALTSREIPNLADDHSTYSNQPPASD